MLDGLLWRELLPDCLSGMTFHVLRMGRKFRDCGVVERFVLLQYVAFVVGVVARYQKVVMLQCTSFLDELKHPLNLHNRFSSSAA